MKSFRERLYPNNSKSIDETIRVAIEGVMQTLENNAEIQEYVTQIRDRRNGIVNIFENFNRNMGIIEENKKIISPGMKNKTGISFEQALDNVIKRRIKNKIESIYEITTQENPNKTDELNRILAQIKDRQVRLEYLLEDYPGNISVLQEYNRPQSISNYIPEVKII